MVRVPSGCARGLGQQGLVLPVFRKRKRIDKTVVRRSESDAVVLEGEELLLFYAAPGGVLRTISLHGNTFIFVTVFLGRRRGGWGGRAMGWIVIRPCCGSFGRLGVAIDGGRC